MRYPPFFLLHLLCATMLVSPAYGQQAGSQEDLLSLPPSAASEEAAHMPDILHDPAVKAEAQQDLEAEETPPPPLEVEAKAQTTLEKAAEKAIVPPPAPLPIAEMAPPSPAPLDEPETPPVAPPSPADANPPIAKENTKTRPAPLLKGKAAKADPAPAAAKPVGWSGSLMFPQDKVDGIMAIYRVYLENLAKRQPTKPGDKAQETVNTKDIINKLKNDQKEVPEEVLTLTLNSLVYYNDKDWTVWLNGARYFRDDALEGMVISKSTLRVVSANRREVTLVWTPIPESFDKVVIRWEDKQQLNKMNMSPLVANDERVEFDRENSAVTITLKPNQTFTSQLMSVLEGKDVKTKLATGKAKDAKEAVDAKTGVAANKGGGKSAPVGSNAAAPGAEALPVSGSEVVPAESVAAPAATPATATDPGDANEEAPHDHDHGHGQGQDQSHADENAAHAHAPTRPYTPDAAQP